MGRLLAVLGAAAILGLTLIPKPGQAVLAAETPLFCLVCGDNGGADVFLNLLLFIPMAAGLRLLGWSWRRVVVASALLSFAVELLQYFVVPGRDASLSDLLTNTVSGAIGAAVAPHFGRLLAPDEGLARPLYSGSIALWLGVLIFSASISMPWAPVSPLRNECSTGSGGSATVRSVALNGVSLKCAEELLPPVALRESLRQGEATLDLVALSGNPAGYRAMIFSVRAPERRLLVLAQDGRSAVFSAPTVGRLLRLHSPVLRLPDAFPAGENIPVELHAGIEGHRTWISSRQGEESRDAELVSSPTSGWSAVLPWAAEVGLPRRVATLLWLGALILPAAYWATFLKRPLWGIGGIAMALVAGLGVLPSLTGYAPAHWSEWLGGFLGAALGWALHRAAAYLQTRCGSPSISAYSSS